MTHRPDLICLGEPLYEFSDIGAGTWRGGHGGDIANVAVAAARQGARSAVASRLGTDAFGDEILARLGADGVDTARIARDPDRPTGLYFIRRDAQGHHFEYRRSGSAATALSPDNLPVEAIRSAGCLHVSGITQAISESACAATATAIHAARAAGARVSYDPNLRLGLWPLERARHVIHETMASVGIALPGLDDARKLTGLETPEEIVRFYRGLGPEIVALTLGPDGALVALGEELRHIPGRPARLVDASGAGDCFDGVLLAHILAGDDPFTAADHAVAAAALSVERLGAIASIPNAAEVRARIDGAGQVDPRPTIAVVAHDEKKALLVDWVSRNAGRLSHLRLVGTGTTAGRIADAVPGLDITPLKSGPLGGDQQIGAMIAEGRIQALIFFIDPLSPMPHDVDVKALTRLAVVYDIPMANSVSTADLVIRAF